MTRPSRLHNNICRRIQTLKGVTVQLSAPSTNFIRLSHPGSPITQVSPLTTATSPWCWTTMYTPRIVSIVQNAPSIPLHSPDILYCVCLYTYHDFKDTLSICSAMSNDGTQLMTFCFYLSLSKGTSQTFVSGAINQWYSLRWTQCRKGQCVMKLKWDSKVTNVQQWCDWSTKLQYVQELWY